MLVFEDGQQAGTLGGGCVEAEVKRHAITVMREGNASVQTFQLDHDYGWDDGLICGGRMTILIQPLTDSGCLDYFDALMSLAESGAGFTEAIVYDAERSKLSVPSSLLFDAADQPLAALNADPAAAETVAANLRPIAQRPRPYAHEGVAYLPLLPRNRLVIVGGGHIGQAVASLAVDLEFEVCVTDDRESYVSDDRFPHVAERIAGPCREVLPSIDITSDTYCLVVTRGHNHDQEALQLLINRGARYVGMIGSRRKIRLIFDELLADGVSSELLDQVHAPVGIDIGSQTVAEIAVSIAAELVSHRNCNGHVPGRPDRVLTAD